MVKETVQSLKAENDKLKEKVDTIFGELQQLKESLKQQRPGSHDASNGDEAGATAKSLDFLSKEYDVLVKFRKQAEERISAMEKSLAVISSRVNNLASAIEQAQEYSYSYNVKLVGVPEIKPRENASETSQLCLNIFNAIGVEIHPYDIDLAHRVTPRQAAEGRPKPIVCKFTRRVSREQVMALRREVTKIVPTSIGLQESDSMENVGLYDHLSPRLQSLLSDAKKVKERLNLAFCWAKNSTVWLRESEHSRPIAIKCARDLDNFAVRHGLAS